MAKYLRIDFAVNIIVAKDSVGLIFDTFDVWNDVDLKVQTR